MKNWYRDIFVFIQTNENVLHELENLAQLYINRFTISEADAYELQIYRINDNLSLKSGLL